MNLNAACRMRGSRAALMVPVSFLPSWSAVEELNALAIPGFNLLGRLNRLKASKRNMRLSFSRTLNCLTMALLMVTKLGPATEFLAEVPNVPRAGTTNAEVLNQH